MREMNLDYILAQKPTNILKANRTFIQCVTIVENLKSIAINIHAICRNHESYKMFLK